MPRRRPVLRLLSSLPLVLFCGSVYAQHSAVPSETLSIHLDPANTQIHFTLRNLLRNAHGSFQLKGGAVAADLHTGLAQGEILVDATTGKTGNAALDRRMQNDVLETNRYPAIFFHPEHMKGALPQEDGTAEITTDGTFNIHGADHPMQLKLHLERHGSALTVTTHFAIPYVAWGMHDPSTGLNHYSKQVEVEVMAKGTVQPVAATGTGASPIEQP